MMRARVFSLVFIFTLVLDPLAQAQPVTADDALQTPTSSQQQTQELKTPDLAPVTTSKGREGLSTPGAQQDLQENPQPVPPPSAQGGIPADAIHLGLRQAIDDGVKGATEILKDQNQTEITGADLMRAYGAFLPNLATNASYGYVDGKSPSAVGSGVFDAKYREGSYQISSTLNVFKGFGDQAFLNASDHRKTASVYTLDRARQLIALDISQAFWQVILDQELVVIAQKNLDISQSRQRLFAGQRKVGSLNAADLYRQIAQTASDQASLIDARNRAQIDLLFLIRRLRLDVKQNYVLETPAAEVPTTPHLVEEKFMINHALRERYDLRAQKNETEATAWDVTNARHTYFPQLDLTAAFSGDGRVYNRAILAGTNELTGPQRSMVGQLGDQTEGSIMLTLTWQPFDRLVTPANVRVAKANESNAEIDLYDASNQVVAEVKQGVIEYHTAIDQVQAAQSGTQAARKAFELISGRYKIGASSFIDLVTTQAALAQAEATEAQSLIRLRLSEQALNTALGRDILLNLPGR